MNLQRIKADAQVRAVNDETRTVTIVASTFAKDSYKTRIDPTGWDLTQFATRNASILWAHDDRGAIAQSAGLPVGKGIGSTVRNQDGKIVMDVQFTSEDENPFGYRVYKLIKGGYLNMVSVGFDPTDWEDVEENNEIVRIYRKQKLIEVSIVAIGANDEALIVQRSATLNRDPEDGKALVSDVESMERMIRSIGKVLIGDDHEKYKSYFEKKQPINKVASRVMEKFFKRVLEEEQPADEKEAWEKMEQKIEATEPTKEPEEAPETLVETPEETPEPPPTEEKSEEPPEPSNPPATEAPQPAPEAPVRIPIAAFRSFPKELAETLTRSAIEALQRGTPKSEVGGVLDAVAHGLKASFIHQ